jgi:hypothetical protein
MLINFNRAYKSIGRSLSLRSLSGKGGVRGVLEAMAGVSEVRGSGVDEAAN